MLVKQVLACWRLSVFDTEKVTIPATTAMIAKTTSSSTSVMPRLWRGVACDAHRTPDLRGSLFTNRMDRRCGNKIYLPACFVALEIISEHELPQNALRHVVQSVEHVRSRHTVTGKAIDFSFTSLEKQIE